MPGGVIVKMLLFCVPSEDGVCSTARCAMLKSCPVEGEEGTLRVPDVGVLAGCGEGGIPKLMRRTGVAPKRDAKLRGMPPPVPGDALPIGALARACEACAANVRSSICVPV